MNNFSQDEFERNIMLESELPSSCNMDGSQSYTSLDDICEYVTLEELYSEYGRDLEQEFREKLNTFLNIIFSQLEKEEVKLMEMKFKQMLSYRQISEITKEPLSTLHYKIKKIEDKIRIIAGCSN